MKNKTILIADDSDIDRTLISQVLVKRNGFKVVEVKDGNECLEIALNQPIDLILMDIMMPEKIGSQVLDEIRKRFNPIELPIIMVTARGETEEIVRCLYGGANDYITKPIDFDIAISRITTHLSLSEISRITSELNQVAALDDLATTYNQEITNVLSTALGYLNTKNLSEENIENIRANLWKIAYIVNKLKELTQQRKATFESYSKARKAS